MFGASIFKISDVFDKKKSANDVTAVSDFQEIAIKTTKLIMHSLPSLSKIHLLKHQDVHYQQSMMTHLNCMTA